jgi:hypothetical protein
MRRALLSVLVLLATVGVWPSAAALTGGDAVIELQSKRPVVSTAMFTDIPTQASVTISGPGVTSGPAGLTLTGTTKGCAPVQFTVLITDPVLGAKNWNFRVLNLPGWNDVLEQTLDGIRGTQNVIWCSGPGVYPLTLGLGYTEPGGTGYGAGRSSQEFTVTMDSSPCAPTAAVFTAGKTVWAPTLTDPSYMGYSAGYMPRLDKYSVRLLDEPASNGWSYCPGELRHVFTVSETGAGEGYFVVSRQEGFRGDCVNLATRCTLAAFGRTYDLTNQRTLRAINCGRIAYAPSDLTRQLCIPIPKKSGTYAVYEVEGHDAVRYAAQPPLWVCRYTAGGSSCQWVHRSGGTIPAGRSAAGWKVRVSGTGVSVQMIR